LDGLRHFTTWIASQDLEAVRQQLGGAPVNLVGGSYGTRAALDYLRQYPLGVRRAVLDGVAPPDMVLPAAASADAQAAFDAALAACEAEAACAQRYPRLRSDWAALLASLPMWVEVAHPLRGRVERFMLTRDALLHFVRGPLYAPTVAAGLPAALHEAAQGRLQALVGLGALVEGRSRVPLAMGMHFSVVCAEDAPRLAVATDLPGADFGGSFAGSYRRICDAWPRGVVPDAFHSVPPAAVAVLLFSGGLDPATPPRHGERVAAALGANALHVVVPQAGHGVMGIGCARDLLFRFIDADTDAQALQLDAGCLTRIPRPGAFLPIAGSATVAQ
jgi:pimeloyl-ACP methyl ester carboxylesterase